MTFTCYPRPPDDDLGMACSPRARPVDIGDPRDEGFRRAKNYIERVFECLRHAGMAANTARAMTGTAATRLSTA